MTLRSGAFADGGAIPARYTCAGQGLAPPLAWRGAPAAARAQALVMEDPDAPGGTFVHWVVIDLSPDTTALRDGRPAPPGRALRNSFGERIYALDAPLRLGTDSSPADARTAIGRHAIASGRLTGRFGR